MDEISDKELNDEPLPNSVQKTGELSFEMIFEPLQKKLIDKRIDNR